MSDVELANRYRNMQQYVAWSTDDARRVAALGPLVAPHADALIADFYAEIARHPEAARAITGGAAQVERLSRTLHNWLMELLGGEYDDAYMERRWKVGHRHVEIGLAQRYTSLAMARLRTGIAQAVQSHWQGSPQELLASLQSLHKLIDLEHALIQDAYEYEFVHQQRNLERLRGERRFRHLVESASCLIVILRPDRSVLYFNPCAQRATGFDEDSIKRANTALTVLGSDCEASARRFDDVLERGESMSYEDQISTQAGPPRWINWNLFRIDDYDDGPAILGVGHDVTEQKRAAQELLQANRLATIGQMYARLAHEGRNALQRLRNCTDLLMDQVVSHPSAVNLLKRSQEAQEDLQRLFDEVRNFAAPINLEHSECRLPVLWREAWMLLQNDREGRNVQIVEQGCDVLPVVFADRFRMVHVFRNIFENALAACDAQAGLIEIRCASSQKDSQSWIEISVHDNGAGFDETAIHRGLEPFFTTKSAGTGLGLAIVKQVLEAHGGDVYLGRSDLGGARIDLTLPCKPPNHAI